MRKGHVGDSDAEHLHGMAAADDKTGTVSAVDNDIRGDPQRAGKRDRLIGPDGEVNHVAVHSRSQRIAQRACGSKAIRRISVRGVGGARDEPEPCFHRADVAVRTVRTLDAALIDSIDGRGAAHAVIAGIDGGAAHTRQEGPCRSAVVGETAEHRISSHGIGVGYAAVAVGALRAVQVGIVPVEVVIGLHTAEGVDAASPTLGGRIAQKQRIRHRASAAVLKDSASRVLSWVADEGAVACRQGTREQDGPTCADCGIARERTIDYIQGTNGMNGATAVCGVVAQGAGVERHGGRDVVDYRAAGVGISVRDRQMHEGRVGASDIEHAHGIAAADGEARASGAVDGEVRGDRQRAG